MPKLIYQDSTLPELCKQIHAPMAENELRIILRAPGSKNNIAYTVPVTSRYATEMLSSLSRAFAAKGGLTTQARKKNRLG